MGSSKIEFLTFLSFITFKIPIKSLPKMQEMAFKIYRGEDPRIPHKMQSQFLPPPLEMGSSKVSLERPLKYVVNRREQCCAARSEQCCAALFNHQYCYNLLTRLSNDDDNNEQACPTIVNNRCCFISAEQHCWNNSEQHCSVMITVLLHPLFNKWTIL